MTESEPSTAHVFWEFLFAVVAIFKNIAGLAGLVTLIVGMVISNSVVIWIAIALIITSTVLHLLVNLRLTRRHRLAAMAAVEDWGPLPPARIQKLLAKAAIRASPRREDDYLERYQELVGDWAEAQLRHDDGI